MIESLSVRAVSQRASKYSPEEQTDNVADCLVSCEMENLSQVIADVYFLRLSVKTEILCANHP